LEAAAGAANPVLTHEREVVLFVVLAARRSFRPDSLLACVAIIIAVDGVEDLERTLNVHAGFAVLIALFCVWHVGIVGLVLERVNRVRPVVAHALPGQGGLILIGAVCSGACSYVAVAAALRGAAFASYRSRPLLPRQRRHAEEGGHPEER